MNLTLGQVIDDSQTTPSVLQQYGWLVKSWLLHTQKTANNQQLSKTFPKPAIHPIFTGELTALYDSLVISLSGYLVIGLLSPVLLLVGY